MRRNRSRTQNWLIGALLAGVASTVLWTAFGAGDSAQPDPVDWSRDLAFCDRPPLPGTSPDAEDASDEPVTPGPQRQRRDLPPQMTYAWTQTIGGLGGDHANDVAPTPDGGVVVVGWFADAVDFDPTGGVDLHTAGGPQSAFVMKLKADGSYAWGHTFGNDQAATAQSVAVDAAGDVVVVGWFHGAVDFDPAGNGDVHVATGAYEDAFVTKRHADGSYAWTGTFGADHSDRAFGVATGDDNSVFIVGAFRHTVDFDPGPGVSAYTSQGNYDIFATRWTAAGAHVWTRTVGGVSMDLAYTATVDGAGDLLLGGSYSDYDSVTGVDFDPGPGEDWHTDGGAFVSKLTAAGDYRWTATFGLNTWASVHDVACSLFGDVLVTGYFTNHVNFNPGPGIDLRSSNGQMPDIYATKLDADGSYAWAYTVGRGRVDGAQGVAVMPTGEVLLTGHFDQNVDFDPGEGTALHVSQGWRDIFVTQLAADGAHLDTFAFGSTAYEEDGAAVAVSRWGDVFYAGRFAQTVDFDPTAAEDWHTAAGEFDLFVTKWAGAGPGLPGDLDDDGDVDLADFELFTACAAGPGEGNPGGACDPTTFTFADHDADGDVDHFDFAALQTYFGR